MTDHLQMLKDLEISLEVEPMVLKESTVGSGKCVNKGKSFNICNTFFCHGYRGGPTSSNHSRN